MILNAHPQGYKQLRRLGVDNFRITAGGPARRTRMFHTRAKGPRAAPAVLPPETGDLAGRSPHTYLSDLRDDVDVRAYTDYREMIDAGVVDAVNDFTTLALHHQVAEAARRRAALAHPEAAGRLGEAGPAHGRRRGCSGG
ncbi:MAG: hypothetical protein R2851_00380 [Caldilineaceae bacterium]